METTLTLGELIELRMLVGFRISQLQYEIEFFEKEQRCLGMVECHKRDIITIESIKSKLEKMEVVA
ncbi:hypothetical protein [Leptospira noguchii]|uniref:Uncharacterized protein n=1 Tax=Leptospira noguchii serovar Panama str. CZ214 TaxID=1001595 RepID=T0FQ19_9LEPT|nr:hypothetical protein [Leptospira noguchii]EQA71660.1 hypothetical protein LEP1GSC059_1105 [Leptospira noguchii serovar Panama str. CZ214]